MSHGPEEHMEHAEHAVHAAGDAFNRVVTMSIAIVAAMLACVTMLGHRAHNDTLRLQGEALEVQTQASIKSTETANKWAYYQTKNMFNLESEIMVDFLDVVATRPDRSAQRDALVKKYQKNVDEYKGSDAAESKLKKSQKEAENLAKQAEQLVKDSQEKIKESQLLHEKGNRFDLGELGLQFGVVLCSLAILTKSRSFWFAGLISSAIGAAVAMSGQFELFIGGHH